MLLLSMRKSSPKRPEAKKQEFIRQRVFKSSWFDKAARKALLTDQELCDAIQQVMLGQADDLGGGVYKKRLNDNMHRSIVLARGGRYWVYQFLFAKKDQDNIADDELAAFKQLARHYAQLNDEQIDQMLKIREFLEICHDCQD